MSSSDDDIDPRAAKGSQSTMKSLFATDSLASQRGSISLKYEAKSKREAAVEGVSAAAAAAAGNAPAGVTPTQSVTAAQATVQVYRGEQPVGPAAAAVVVANNIAIVALIDRERRPLCRVRCNADLQLLQNAQAYQYATLYDPAIAQHWTLMFRSPAECTQFVAAATTILHYLQLGEGPVEPFADMSSAEPRGHTIKRGSRASVSLTMWLLRRLDSSGGGTFFTVGKVIEEISPSAPRLVDVGSGAMMVGIEEVLVGMRAGGRRLAFVSPKKTRLKGIGNPEIGPSDSVVALLCVHEVIATEGGVGDPGSNSDDDLTAARQKKSAAKRDAAAPKPQPRHQDLEAPTPAPAPLSTTVPSSIAPQPVPTAAPAQIDQNTLLQTMLLQTLQLQQQQQQQQRVTAAASPTSTPSAIPSAQMELLYQQLFALSDKIERLDIEGKIAKNNDTIERIVKKAVGKLPVNDVDIEDMSKDRDQLLAKIEHLKQRLDEMQDNYHRALETMSSHKEVVANLKNDLTIERETSAAKLRELQERKRLELVDLEVRHRKAADELREKTYQEAKEEWFQKGLAAGRVEALHITGTTSNDELQRKLHEAEQALVDAESRIQQQSSRFYQERREMNDQIDSLNGLIKRLESRETTAAQNVTDTSSAMCKTLRRAMNSTYASIEAQLYATERESVSVEDALAMVLISIKSETKSFVEEIKREGQLIASAAATVEAKRQARTDVNDAIAAYTVDVNRSAAVSSPPTDEGSSTAGTDAYRAMREEIEAYQRERDAAHREYEVHASAFQPGILTGADTIRSEVTPKLSSAELPAVAAVDTSMLPIPEDDGGDSTHDALPPPPPLPAHLFNPSERPPLEWEGATTADE